MKEYEYTIDLRKYIKTPELSLTGKKIISHSHAIIHLDEKTYYQIITLLEEKDLI